MVKNDRKQLKEKHLHEVPHYITDHCHTLINLTIIEYILFSYIIGSIIIN